VHLIGYFRSCIMMHGFMNVKKQALFQLVCNTENKSAVLFVS